MLRKVYVWGDSIAKGIVFDAARGRYVGLRERSGFSRAAEALHVEMENHARFGMTSQRGRLALENGLQSAEPGSPVLLSFGGNDVDYDWAAISETPKERHDPHVLPEQFAENMAQMVRDARGAGLIPVLLTLPPIDSERYFSWVTRGLEKGENVLKWLGDVERIYRSHGPDYFGYEAHMDPFSLSYHNYFAPMTGALPNGRQKGVALTDASVSAMPGTDVNGSTALIKSAAQAIDTVRNNCNHMNMKFLPSALEGPSGTRMLLNLIKTYFDLGGGHIQFNCVSSETLCDAQEHPQNYKNLVVRVAGFSSYFTRLYKGVQDEIIKRTEYQNV
mgnify:CR=1 FL=1